MTSAPPMTTLVEGLRDRGFHVTLAGEDLHLGPPARVTLPVREWLYRNHDTLVRELKAEPVVSEAEFSSMARQRLNPEGTDYGPPPVGQALAAGCARRLALDEF